MKLYSELGFFVLLVLAGEGHGTQGQIESLLAQEKFRIRNTGELRRTLDYLVRMKLVLYDKDRHRYVYLQKNSGVVMRRVISLAENVESRAKLHDWFGVNK